jgi:hypothetical protein
MVMSNNQTLEGPWEEILAHGSELAGHRVKLTVLSNETFQDSHSSPQTLDQALEGLIGTVSFESPPDLTNRSEDYFAEILLEKQQNNSAHS